MPTPKAQAMLYGEFSTGTGALNCLAKLASGGPTTLMARPPGLSTVNDFSTFTGKMSARYLGFTDVAFGEAVGTAGYCLMVIVQFRPPGG